MYNGYISRGECHGNNEFFSQSGILDYPITMIALKGWKLIETVNVDVRNNYIFRKRND